MIDCDDDFKFWYAECAQIAIFYTKVAPDDYVWGFDKDCNDIDKWMSLYADNTAPDDAVIAIFNGVQ
jgi:hypothetical protein